MASVTSLDQDMRKLRMDRYTPKAANEVRSWIEDVLGDRLPGGDLLDALKDGTVLCRLESTSEEVTQVADLVQTHQSSSAVTRRQVQEVGHAFYTNGEHLPLPQGVRDAAPKHARARSLPHRRPLRVQRSSASPAMHHCLQSSR
jgi:hypothetical protein